METFYAKGLYYREQQDPGVTEFAQTIPSGSPLQLEREPTNKADRNAIKVLYEGRKLAYVEKDVASFLSPTMAEGAVVTTTLQTIELAYPNAPWLLCEYSVKFPKKEEEDEGSLQE